MEQVPDSMPDGWYQELSLEFEDGSTERFFIQRKPTGTHIPLLRERPEPWTDLKFHKCPCCPFPDMMLSCPAAISLQTTLAKLRKRQSIENVKATAIDARGRAQTVEWPMQAVGSTLVQLAVFASGCPVGRQFKPYLQDLPPFVSSLDLSKHIGAKILEKHGGSTEAARQDLLGALKPLHEVFMHLARRLKGDQTAEAGEGALRDAVPNSIAQVDAFAQLLALRSDELFAQLFSELGWDLATHQADAKGQLPKSVWDKVRDLF